MGNSTEDLFIFLEQSPYFYQKENSIAETGGVKNKEIIYTFFTQESPFQAVAQIIIPVRNPKKDVVWKYIQINDDINRPIFQEKNSDLEYMPGWFKLLILKVNDVYRDAVLLFRIFFDNHQFNI